MMLPILKRPSGFVEDAVAEAPFDDRATFVGIIEDSKEELSARLRIVCRWFMYKGAAIATAAIKRTVMTEGSFFVEIYFQTSFSFWVNEFSERISGSGRLSFGSLESMSINIVS